MLLGLFSSQAEADALSAAAATASSMSRATTPQTAGILIIDSDYTQRMQQRIFLRPPAIRRCSAAECAKRATPG
jgi:hypothetical protein